MEDMISYVFNKLEATEKALAAANKALTQQKRSRNNILFIAIVYAVVSTRSIWVQEKQIEALRTELEELKRAKGE